MAYVNPSWGMLLPLTPLSEELAPMPDVRRFLRKSKSTLVLSALGCCAVFLFFLPQNFRIYSALAVFAAMCTGAFYINRLYFQKITDLAINGDLFTTVEGVLVTVRFTGFGLMDIFARIQPADDSPESPPFDTAAVAAANKSPLYIPPFRDIEGILYMKGDKAEDMGIVSGDLILYGKPSTKAELESRWYVNLLSMGGAMALGLFLFCAFTALLVFQPKEQLNLEFCLLTGLMILISILLILVSALFFSKMIRYKKLQETYGKI